MSDMKERELEMLREDELLLRRQTARDEADDVAWHALHRRRPHVLYGALVWQTGSSQPGRQWACGILPMGQTAPRQVTYMIIGEHPWPRGFGSTPREACHAFDELWETGKQSKDGEAPTEED